MQDAVHDAAIASALDDVADLLEMRGANPFQVRAYRAASRNVAVEINASPHRLDLSDVRAHRARELGVKGVISTDAHSPRELDYMPYGVDQARRAWCQASDVLNTLPWTEFDAWRRKTSAA